MESGKKIATFAFDGLQMVYRAVKKQTNEYLIASQKEKATMMTNESSTTPTAGDDSKTVSTKPFFATVATKDSLTKKTAYDNNHDGKTKSTSVINDSLKSFFGAVRGSNDIDESITKKELTQIDYFSIDDKSNVSTLLSVAGATETDDNNNKKKKEEVTIKLDSTIMANEIPMTSTTTVADAIHHAGTTPTIPTNHVVERSSSSSSSSSSPNTPSSSSSTSSSSSLLRSGGKMLWKFVGDGLQMVAQQVVASSLIIIIIEKKENDAHTIFELLSYGVHYGAIWLIGLIVLDRQSIQTELRVR